MVREKFLQQVADYYLSKGEDLAQMTFVFPNRRSAMFMRKYLQDGMERPQFMPRMISITYFIQQFNTSALATQTELSFLLYKTYCRILRKHGKEDQIPEFDKFYFWGSIVLNDFNDVDAYMADADQLYRNLKELKSIRSYYLTDEQKEVVNYLWGENYPLGLDDKFWDHMPDGIDENKPSAKFLNLWEIMGELYNEFIKDLDSQPNPLAYSGLQSKRASIAIKEMTAEDFSGMRYVFVGFNVLSVSRTLIFKRLKDLGIADFFWDIASPLIAEGDRRNSFGRFIMPLAKKLPMPADFELLEINHVPDIEIISVPSNFGQTKVASAILNTWIDEWKAESDEHKIDPERLVNTAIVMPDDHLLMPMLYAINPEIEPINVTMSISYSATPFAALMSSIISMHLRARKRRGVYTYYYQDVIDVLTHPHISLIEPNHSKALKEEIMHNHLYNVGTDYIENNFPTLTFLFNQIDNPQDINEVRSYIDTLIKTLRERLISAHGNDGSNDFYELHILDGYAMAVEDLCTLIQRYDIKVQERTFLQMIKRALSMTPINFIGKPLKGLQVMNIMDTRALDFKNLIMMSMNERIFPKRSFSSSLIPWNLRNGYMLPSQEHEENSNAYQFYRLLSRAERVRLLYDSRTSGITSGEMSRYLSQLLHLNKDYGIKVRTAEFKVEAENICPITINKTEEVNAELARFCQKGGLNLSASAMKAYLSCPLRFYLQYVKGLRGEEDTLDYIDAASYGTVIHSLVQDLYLEQKGRLINESAIKDMLNHDIEHMAMKKLDEKYYRSRYADNLEMLPGEGKVISKIISQYVRKMLEREMDLPDYTFIDAESGERIVHRWKINDKYTVNFTMSIDRIDQFENPDNPNERILRFIDYKTGSDSLYAKNLDEVFNNSDNGGIFQLLLYSNAYAQIYGYEGAIKPVIYKFMTIPSKGIEDLRIGKTVINNYKDINELADGESFIKKFEEVIDHIFEVDNKYPFCQTDNTDHCKYCQFAQMCSRHPDDKKY